MIYYLKGKITIKEKDFLIFDVQGVGYKIFVEGDFKDETIIYCFLQRSDKDTKLFGFKEKENLELFEKLIKMPGIGPKTALKIASIASVEELKRGIEKEDKIVMEKIFSIGKKKGQQVVFELSQKFVEKKENKEAFDTLKNLGFSEEKIEKVLREIGSEDKEEKRVEKALKILGKDDQRNN
jgi:holliday junction DNA helicase RuvA